MVGATLAVALATTNRVQGRGGPRGRPGNNRTISARRI